MQLDAIISFPQTARVALVDVPLFEEAVYARGVCGLDFVVAVDAVLRVKGGVLANVFYVD